MEISASVGFGILAGGSDEVNVYLSDAELSELDITDFGDLDNTQVQELVERTYDSVHVSVCHSCAKSISDPEVDEISSITFHVDDEAYAYSLVNSVWERDQS